MDIVPSHIGIQLVVFLCVMAVLNGFVFQPLLRIHQLRQKKTLARENEAKEMMERSQILVQRYDQSLAETRSEVSRKMQAAILEANQHNQTVLQKARQQGQALFAEQKTRIQSEQQNVRQAMQAQVEGVANEMVQTILH